MTAVIPVVVRSFAWPFWIVQIETTFALKNSRKDEIAIPWKKVFHTKIEIWVEEKLSHVAPVPGFIKLELIALLPLLPVLV